MSEKRDLATAAKILILLANEKERYGENEGAAIAKKAVEAVIQAEAENTRLKAELDEARQECDNCLNLRIRVLCNNTAERVKALEAALRGLLLSADCSWEERGEGHDWREACQAARKVLEVLGDGLR